MRRFILFIGVCVGCLLLVSCSGTKKQPPMDDSSDTQSKKNDENSLNNPVTDVDLDYAEMAISLHEVGELYSLENMTIPQRTICQLSQPDGTGWDIPEGNDLNFNYTLADGTEMNQVNLQISCHSADEEIPYAQMDKTSGFFSFIGENDTERYIYIKNMSDMAVTFTVCEAALN